MNYPYNVTTQETVIQSTPAVKATNIHVYQNKHFSLPHIITGLSTYSFTVTYILIYIKMLYIMVGCIVNKKSVCS